MKESVESKKYLLELSKQGCTLFRNNVGLGWTGEYRRLKDGSIIISNPRPLHAGLVKGSGDFIGFTPITITEEMVGKQVAVFTNTEFKTPTGRASEAQLKFNSYVIQMGGFSAIVKTVDDASRFLTVQLQNLDEHYVSHSSS